MKNFLKLTAAVILTVMLFTQCDSATTTYYQYKNETLTPVTMNLLWIREDGSLLRDELINLESGKIYEQQYQELGNAFQPALANYNHYIISNNKKQKSCSREEGGGLYDNENYQIVSSKKNSRTYRFTFTDEFFENGEPVNQ